MNVNNHNSSLTLMSAGCDLDPEGQLALLVLESEQTQSDAARQDRAVARESYVAASNKVVEEMHSEASHMLVGAFVQGACVVTASVVQLGDACDDPINEKTGEIQSCKESPWGEIVAGGFNGTAPVMGRAVGDEPAGHARARAENGRCLEKQAEWQLDDANKAIDHSQKSRDKALEFLSTVHANNASTETAIIAGFA